MIFEMPRRAKLLNQLAHLQLLQRCTVPCRRGRELVGIIADALRKSEAPSPLPLQQWPLQCILPAQSKVWSLHSQPAHSLSLALLAALRQTTTKPTTSNPHSNTPARPHKPTQVPTHFGTKPILAKANINAIGALGKREAVT